MKATKIIAALAAVIIMSACGAEESSVIQPPVVEIPQSTSAVTELTEQTVSDASSTAPAESTEPIVLPETEEQPEITTEPTEEPPVEVLPETEEPPEELDPMDYGAYLLTNEEMEFVNRSIFVGDSICKGYGTYNVISFDHVYANGSMGTRNFDEYTFTHRGEEVSFDELLERTAPELIFLSMGMNDINMIHPSQYRENYAGIVDRALSESSAVIYLCAMTPVDSNFTSNERVDYFNNELKQLAESYPERVYYVNYGVHMLNDDGVLNNQLDGGDGVHLSPYAYRIALWEIRRTLVEDGTLYPAQMRQETSEVAAEAAESTEAVETTETLEQPVTSEPFTEETAQPEGIPVE